MEIDDVAKDNSEPVPECSESQKDTKPANFFVNHTFLFTLPLPDDETVPLTPRVSDDKWDDDHVKPPTNPSNTYLEIDEHGDQSRKSRWDLVKEALTASPITDSHKLEEAVKKYTRKQEMSFKALHQLFDDDFSEKDSAVFFESVLPKMIELALRLPELIKAPIPLLKIEMNHSLSLSQEQAACLLANAFFCTFPGRKWKSSSFPEINFYRLFGSSGDHVVEKLKCILHYFKRVSENMPSGVLTFQRRFIKKSDFPDFDNSTVKLSSVKVTMSADKRIEDGAGMLQVDFANRFLGGGVLGWGCVQEEIRFVINPEMIVGMLFCESMNLTEAIVMTGCERFSKYEGYSRSFKWAGKFDDETPRDDLRRRKTYVVAIDAMAMRNADIQFMEALMARELRKATVGFFHDPQDADDPIPVCSGNWGCGAFGGDVKLKALIQIMACSLNRRDLVYCTFGNYHLVEEVTKMTSFFEKHEITVGTLWKYLKAFKVCHTADRSLELYSYIYKQHSKAKNMEVAALESRDTVIDMETGCVENPPAKKRRTSDEAENEVLESSVASLNVKLSGIDASEGSAASPVALEEKTETEHEVSERRSEVSGKEVEIFEKDDEDSNKHDEASEKEVDVHQEQEEAPENPKLVLVQTVLVEQKKLKITDFFKPK